MEFIYIMKRVRIGIVGCGAIGGEVAKFVDKKLQKQCVVFALSDKNIEAAEKVRRRLKVLPKIYSLDDLIKKVDLVIEAASIKAAKFILKKAVASRKNVIILSTGALINNNKAIEEAKKKNVKIYLPSGAICGADGLGALSVGKIKKISLTTSKPPKSLIGADYLKKKKINLTGLKEEKVIFKGKVSEAIKFFPKNINVAATILLASSFKDVSVCIKADPALRRNVHKVEIEAKEAKISISVENTPSKANPKTSTLAILSIQHLLRKLFSSLKVGS